MKSLKYLDALVEKKGFKNDRQLALHMGWSSGIMTHYRQGTRVMSEEQCLQVARELGMENPLPVIAAAGIDRAEKTGQRSLWEVFTKATSLNPLAVALLIGVTSMVTPSPAEAAPDLIQQMNEYVLCQIVGGRKRRPPKPPAPSDRPAVSSSPARASACSNLALRTGRGLMRSRRIDLAEILGREWEEIVIGADGLLYLPGWRRGFEAGDLKAIFYDNQERYRLRHEAAQLRRELERLQAALDQTEKAVWWYRRQLALE